MKRLSGYIYDYRCISFRQAEQAILNGESRNSTVKLSHKIEVRRAFLASNAIRVPEDRMARSSAWCSLQGIELSQLEGLIIPTENANEIGAEVWHDDVLPSRIGDRLVLMRSILPVRHRAGLVESVSQLLVKGELPAPVEEIGDDTRDRSRDGGFVHDMSKAAITRPSFKQNRRPRVIQSIGSIAGSEAAVAPIARIFASVSWRRQMIVFFGPSVKSALDEVGSLVVNVDSIETVWRASNKRDEVERVLPTDTRP
ncbi:hypothetical protein KC368_g90 [Hortaea werneckii]|nr:hypothetical protein KC368_g90 [Hortaea werneckii]